MKANSGSTEGGEYSGRILVELLDDGRLVRVHEEFGFRDYLGEQWTVREGAIVDGASIPRALWTMVGSPFTGKYRNASVIHDYYCDVRDRSWEKVHRVFYDAMRASGVGMVKAKAFYSAVYFGGPRWSETVRNNASIASGQRESSSGEPLLQAVRDAVSYEALAKDAHLESAGAAYGAVLDLEAMRSVIERFEPSIEALDRSLEAARGSPSSGSQAFAVRTTEDLQFGDED